jgi:hypothetical protein
MLSDASPVSDLLALLRERCTLPAGASQRLAVPLPGITVHLIRSRSRERVRADADALLAEVDPLQGGGPGSCHVRGPRRDGTGGWYAFVVLEQL